MATPRNAQYDSTSATPSLRHTDGRGGGRESGKENIYINPQTCAVCNCTLACDRRSSVAEATTSKHCSTTGQGRQQQATITVQGRLNFMTSVLTSLSALLSTSTRTGAT